MFNWLKTGAPKFRFTLRNDTLGNLVINEPIGWDEIIPELDRDKTGWGLVEIIDTPLTFYSKGGRYDGGMEYLLTAEGLGLNQKVYVDAEIDPIGKNQWQHFYSGRVAFDLRKEFSEGKRYKYEVPIIREDSWSEFINHKGTPVNLSALKDLFGNVRVAPTPDTLKLPSQVINKRSQFTGHTGDEDTLQPCVVATTANITLSGHQTIDGVLTTEGMRVFVRNQSTQANNGPYTASSGAWTRTADGNTGLELEHAIVSIQQGTTLAGKVYRIDQGSITLGSTSITTSEYNYVDEYIFFEKDDTGSLQTAYEFYTPITANLGQEEIDDTFEQGFSTTEDLNDIGEVTEIISEQGELQASGSVDISYRLSGTASTSTVSTSRRLWVRWFVQLNDDTPILVDEYDVTAAIPVTEPIYFNLTGSQGFNVFPGDRVKMYLHWYVKYNGGIGNWITKDFYGGIVDETVNLDFKSTVPATTTPGFLLHDAYGYIADRILGGTGRFYSETLGGLDTKYRQYDSNGCHKNYFLSKFLQIRGFNLTDKPFFASFDDIHGGADPVICLGFQMDTIDGVSCLRVEERSWFFNSSSNSVNLSKVNGIEAGYLPDLFYSRIKVGYEKWESESIGGIDDPQTRRVFATMFATMGKELTIYSKFIAASLGIEVARRTSKEKSADFQYDNDIAIVACLPDGTQYRPELGSDLDGSTNLNDGDTRYNQRITATRNLLRFLDFISGCMELEPSSTAFTFQSGEGNFAATTELPADGCAGDFGGASLAEDQDIPKSTTPLFIPRVRTFTHPLTFEQYDTIRNNKNLSIGVSQTTVNHIPHFIMNLKYQTTQGKAEFVLLEAA